MDRLADLDPGLTVNAQGERRLSATNAASPRVAVIGGGWAGLAAAVELAAAGISVTLFEAGRELGGRARRVEIHGHALDNGQHLLIGAYRETLRLMKIVDAPSGQALHRRPLALEVPGAGFALRLPALPAPLHLAWGLLGARGVPFAEKLAAAGFAFWLKQRRFELDDEPVAALLDRHRQQGALRRHLWDALCLAALNTPPERASARIYANVLRDSLGAGRTDTDLLIPVADLGTAFPDAAERFIVRHGGIIRRAMRIGEVEATEQGFAVDGGKYDHVVIATAPQHAAPLLAALPAAREVAAMLSDYDYEPIGTVYAGYPPEVTLPAPMLGLENNDSCIGQWVFDRGLLPANRGVLAFVLSAHAPWEALDNDTLARSLHREISAALGRPLPPPRWTQVIRERRATFSCRPHLPRPSAETPVPGLWLAGDYVCADYPATIEGAVRSGVETAGMILLACEKPLR